MQAFDVLVIGAGPAGAAAARRAALSGLSVALVDRSEFPRDKVCGDALIPDALQALTNLGMLERVLPLSLQTSGVRVYAPNGMSVALSGRSACVPRGLLDETLQSGALEAGATFRAPLKVVAPLIEGQTIVGGRFRDLTRREDIDIRARVTILATGASADPLKVFGVCHRVTPSATAARIYVQGNSAAAAEYGDLVISYDASICPGYGWIFPGPRNTFNVGVGFFYDARRLPVPGNLRLLLRKFLNTFPPAIGLMQRTTMISSLRGASLRTAMTGADFARTGLLVVGDAAGFTYSLSGEGIGKALETGMLAADTAASMLSGPAADVMQIGIEYTRQVQRRFARTFRAYRHAQDLLTSPAIANLLAWRANAGTFARSRLEEMFAATGNPRDLFSPIGLAQALFR
jgi:menaquinone-9 beta-reductase